MKRHGEVALDLQEVKKRLSGKDWTHFQSRLQKAAHILEELVSMGLDPARPLKALDVGSGLSFIPYILAHHTAWDMHCGDVNTSDIYKYPWLQEHITLSYLDGTAMPFAGQTFDVVLCNHVIEHVPVWEALVAEMHRVVKPGGLVYLATPNRYRPGVPWKMWLSRSHAIARDVRMTLHLGFSLAELMSLFHAFAQRDSLNRRHVLLNCPRPLRPLLALVPTPVYNVFSPNNVLVARK